MDTNDKRKMLAQAILSIESKREECFELLEDICTIKEVDDMANRFQIALLLYEGKTFIDVEKPDWCKLCDHQPCQSACLKHGKRGTVRLSRGCFDQNEGEGLMRTFKKSKKLDNVCYDIRGPVVEEADRMTAEGIDIIMLNTGNPPTFNLNAPDEVIREYSL